MNRETFITETTQRIQSELNTLLRAGDRDVAQLVDEGFGARMYDLHPMVDSVQYHIDMARGVNRYQVLVQQILADEAEVRALKLAEQAEAGRAEATAEYKFELARERAAA